MAEVIFNSESFVYHPPPKKHILEVGNVYYFLKDHIFHERSEDGDSLGKFTFLPKKHFIILSINRKRNISKILYESKIFWIHIRGIEEFFIDIEQVI
jgi:hypothetical protein